jgi:hypothetical protein
LIRTSVKKDFETVRKREAEFAELFARHRSLSISYEEMIAGEPAKIQGLLDFLGVSQRNLTTTTQRLGCDNLRHVITNFEELRAHFAGTPFAEFVDEV